MPYKKPLYFLNADTGEIIKGIYKPCFRKNGQLIQSRATFIVNHKEYSELTCSMTEAVIDIAYKILQEANKTISTVIHSIQISEKLYHNGDTAYSSNYFFVFSSIEKAKFVNKKFLLPKLMEYAQHKVSQAQQEFTNQVEEYSRLEKLLSDCNIVFH